MSSVALEALRCTASGVNSYVTENLSPLALTTLGAGCSMLRQLDGALVRRLLGVEVGAAGERLARQSGSPGRRNSTPPAVKLVRQPSFPRTASYFAVFTRTPSSLRTSDTPAAGVTAGLGGGFVPGFGGGSLGGGPLATGVLWTKLRVTARPTPVSTSTPTATATTISHGNRRGTPAISAGFAEISPLAGGAWGRSSWSPAGPRSRPCGRPCGCSFAPAAPGGGRRTTAV